MAFVITALREIKLIDTPCNSPQEWEIVVNEKYPNLAADLVNGTYQAEFDNFEFSLGNRTFVLDWCKWLKDEVASGEDVFDDLFNFDDLRGVIGSQKCLELYEVFSNWLTAAHSAPDRQNEYFDTYCIFLAALNHTKEQGCLIFH